MQGHPRLVNALSALYSRILNRHLDPNNDIIITAGAYEALFSTLQGHTSPGDEWIIIEPFFDCYVPMVKTAGGVPRFIPLKPVSSLLLFLAIIFHIQNSLRQLVYLFAYRKKPMES